MSKSQAIMTYAQIFNPGDRVKSNGGKCANHGRNCFLEPRTYEIEVKTATPVKVY